MILRPDPSLPPLPSPDDPTEAGPGAAPRRSPWKAGLVFVVMMAAGGAFGSLIGGAAKASKGDLSGVQSAAMIAGALAALPATLLAHEVGHLIGGLLAGFRFGLLVVGPLKVVREGGAIRVRLNTNLAIAGGLAACLPSGPGDHRRGTILMVAAGPAMSLAAAAAGLLGSYGFGGFLAWPGGWPTVAAVVLAVFGLASLGIGLVTLIPGRTSGFMTDGARLLGLLRGGPETVREVAVLGLTAESSAGRRPREWDAGRVALATSLPDGSLMDAFGELLAYSASLDRGDLAAARDRLARSLALADRLPSAFRPSIALEAAHFEAAARGDAAAARRWLDRAGRPGGLVPAHLRPMAEAAVLVAEGDGPGAIPLIAAAREALRRVPDPGTLDFYAEMLDTLERRARELGRPAPVETDGASPAGAAGASC